MLFTWNTENLCLVFRWWHIGSTTTLLLSLAAVILITAGYEALRSACRRYEESVDNKTNALPSRWSFFLLH
jgi:copper transporter 1